MTSLLASPTARAVLLVPLFAAACVFSTTGTGLVDRSSGGSGTTASTTSGESSTSTSSVGGAGTGGATSTGSTVTASETGGTGGAAPLFPYAYRKKLRVTASTSALPPDYSVSFTLDHATAVAESKSLASGDDVRVYRDVNGALIELDRRLDPMSVWNTGNATVWFRTVEPIAALTEDASYWVYYGNPAANSPPQDGNKVYSIWTDFDDGSPQGNGWSLANIGDSQASTSEQGGLVTIKARTDDIWGKNDDFAFLHHAVTGDFVADSRVVSMAGQLGAWSKMGGVMIRQSLNQNSRNRLMSPVWSAMARTNSFRLNDNGSTDEKALTGKNPTPEIERVTRIGDKSRAFFSKDGVTWEEDGTEVTFGQPLIDPVLVGIPACNLDTGSDATVVVDWFRVRKLVAAEPSVTVDAEEKGPF